MDRSQSLNDFAVSSSINGDGAAEPVSDSFNEGEEDLGEKEFSSSWPTAFTSASPGSDDSGASKQVSSANISLHSF